MIATSRVRTAAVVGSLACGGILWAGISMASSGLPAGATAPIDHAQDSRLIRNANGWAAVSSDERDVAGYLNPNLPPQWVKIRNPGTGTTVELGFQIVVNDKGIPIGHLGPQGYVDGGVTPAGTLTPTALARLQGGDPGAHRLKAP